MEHPVDRTADRVVGRDVVAVDNSLAKMRKAAMLRVASFAKTDSRLQCVNPISTLQSTWCTHRG